MRTKDQILLEQAYQKMYKTVVEHEGDKAQDDELRFNLISKLKMWKQAKSDDMEDPMLNIEGLVNFLMDTISAHCDKKFNAGSDNQADIDAGMQARGEV